MKSLLLLLLFSSVDHEYLDLEIEMAECQVTLCEARVDATKAAQTAAEADREIAAESVRFTALECQRAQKAGSAITQAEFDEWHHEHKLALLEEKRTTAEVDRCKAEVRRRQAAVQEAKIRVQILRLKGQRQQEPGIQ